MSFEHLEEEAYEYSKKFTRISTCLFMRKYKLNYHAAKDLCTKIRLRWWTEARQMAKEMKNI